MNENQINIIREDKLKIIGLYFDIKNCELNDNLLNCIYNKILDEKKPKESGKKNSGIYIKKSKNTKINKMMRNTKLQWYFSMIY